MVSDDLPRETYDAADAGAEDNAKRDASRAARQASDFWRGAMHTKNGRAVLYRLLDRCHINNTPDFGEETHRQARALGRESVGKEILLAMMEASVDLYMQMIKEQQEEEKRLDEVRRREARKREEDEAPPKAEEMLSVRLPPPVGFPGGPAKPPAAPPKKGKR